MHRKDLIMLCRLCVEMLRGTEYNASLKNLHVLIALLLLHSQKTQLEQQTIIIKLKIGIARIFTQVRLFD